MPDKFKPSNEGYRPEVEERGYQPRTTEPVRDPVQGGYQPTSQGDNPTNTPPGEE
ncbi:hypothetical protein ACW7G2_09895 [Luteimonas sp. A277]